MRILTNVLHSSSIIRRAVVGCSLVLIVFMVITALGSFAVGYDAAKSRQDRLLKEVVGML